MSLLDLLSERGMFVVGPDLERIHSNLDPVFGQVRQQACRIGLAVLRRRANNRHDLNRPRQAQ